MAVDILTKMLASGLLWSLAAHASTDVFSPLGVCSELKMTTFNATGSVKFPGFHTPSSTNSTWTLGTAVKNIPNPSGDYSSVQQTFWIDTKPAVNLSTNELPFQGCALAIYGGRLARQGIPTNVDGGNNCDTVIPKECQDAIMQTVNIATSQQLQSNELNATSNVCNSTILDPDHPPKGCPRDLWELIFVGSKSSFHI